MKTSRIAALTLIASAAVGFNAYAGETSEFTPDVSQKFVSTLTRAQVQADAVQANLEKIQRGYLNDQGVYLISAPVQSNAIAVTREAVRADAIKARSMTTDLESNS
jgi:Domain of unknown function (DUF4148)